MEGLRFAVFVGVLVIFTATLSPVEAGFKKAADACMQQTGATKADLDNFVKTGEANQNLKCMMSCALQAVKFMQADGSIDSATTKSHMPSVMGPLVETCTSKAQPESDVCQRAFVFLNCFAKAEPKVFVEFVTTD